MDLQTETNSNNEDYVKRKEEFTAKLLAFHRMRGNPIRRFPLLGGRELDLYHLYTKVQQMGGSDIVTKERNWGEVSRSFNLPSTVTSASYACRQNYLKFLLEYEQVENQDPSSYPNPLDRVPRVPPTHPLPLRQSKQVFPLPSNPVSTPYLTPTGPTVTPSNPKISQNSFSLLSSHLPNLLSLPGLQGLGNLLDQLGKAPNQLQVLSSMLNLPPNQVQLLELLMQQRQKQMHSKALEIGRYDWLVRSLQSGFPNEIDFTMNVLLIMSSDNKGVIPLSSLPHLADILLAHVGVFSKDDPYLEVLYHEEWHTSDDIDYHRMWEETTPTHIYLSILSTIQHPSDKDTCFSHLFPLKSVLSEDNVESFRVSQVAIVLRNLSYDETNATFLASHQPTLKFLVLGINCSLPSVCNYCLDALVAIAPHLSLSSSEAEANGGDGNSVSHLLMTSLQELILCNDRQALLKAVECMGSLAYSPDNFPYLCQVSPEVVSRVFQCLLLTDDVHLVVTCLNALYCLTFIGGTIACTVLDCSLHSVDILIDLLTLNYKGHPHDIIGRLVLVHSSGKEEPVTMTTKPNDKPSSSVNTVQATKIITQKQTVVATPSVSTATTSSNTSISSTPHRQPKQSKVQLKNLFTAKNNMESTKVAFGKQWLQTFYMVAQDGFISKGEMYSRYLSSCAQLKLKTAATQTEFDLILKEAFPKITFTNVKLSGQDIQIVGGVAKRPLPTPVSQQSSSSKPDSVSVGSSSPTPSRSPSPASPSSTPLAASLSPLQQLIQQTKSKTTSSLAKASPLLVANKMRKTNKTNTKEKSGKVKEQKVIVNGLLSSNDMPLLMNGNASKEEKQALLNDRKRPLELDNDYVIPLTKRPKTSETKTSSPDSITIDTPPTCISATPTTMPNHCTVTTPSSNSSPLSSSTIVSSSTGTHLSLSTSRSSSLPPFISNNHSSVQTDHSKARSLTPPSNASMTLSTAELLLDTLNLIKPTATSIASLPGTTARVISNNSSFSSPAPSGLVCLWNNCQKIRVSQSDLFYHVMYDHLAPSSHTHSDSPSVTPSVCQWIGCANKIKRMLPSLLRHVQIHHCSGSYSTVNKPVLPNVAQTLLRLRTVPQWTEEAEEGSSVISSTIHLTAALVLRNLLETVPQAKSRLLQYESVLTQIALSSSEASNAVTQCLFLLTQQPPSPDALSPSKNLNPS